MRGEFGDEDGSTVDVGEMRFRQWGPTGIVEVAPEVCLAGHLLRYPNVLVGWDGVGRTFQCDTCYQAGTRPHTMRYRFSISG